MKALVCNAGSTSLKCKLYHMPDETVLAAGKVERVGSREDAIFQYANAALKTSVFYEKQCVPDYRAGIELFLNHLLSQETGAVARLEEIDCVGFKTVLSKDHYGVHALTQDVLNGMRDYMIIAPAHNAAYLAVIQQFQQCLPNVPMIGVFETAFHTTIPEERYLYSVPYAWYAEYGVRKFGYHGASHSYVADTIGRMTGRGSRIVSCHLGGSCSVCAIEDGKSVDNSFGFSLQCGVLHSNRCGDIDPYLIPYMVGRGMTLDEVVGQLTVNGGLKGVSGVSGDYRQVREAAEAGNERAALAIRMFINDIIKTVGAYAAELKGIDDLVFTAGIGENAPELRAGVCGFLRHLGVKLDADANAQSGEAPRVISAADSKVRVWVVPANEELVVARECCRYLRAGGE